MKTKISLLIVIVFFSIKSYSQTDSTAKPVQQAKEAPLPKGIIQFTPDQIEWKDGPATLPKGTQMSVLYGDPKAACPFAMRLKLPANQVIKVHSHPKDEVVTVIEGSVMVGFGERIQMSKTKTFTAGSFYVNPANAKHYVAVGKDGATVQINGIGPWTIVFSQ
jgi:quercetin dioxygenase-like cupin family protein